MWENNGNFFNKNFMVKIKNKNKLFIQNSKQIF